MNKLLFSKKIKISFVLIALSCVIYFILHNTLKDDFQPVIDIEEDLLEFETDYIYNYEDNFNVAFGKRGGTVSLTNELVDDIETITIVAKGKNKLETIATYEIKRNNTTGRNVIFFGDSILDGYQAGMYSYGDIIADTKNFNSVEVFARSGARLTPYERNLNEIVKSHKDDEIKYDFVILEGGINDIICNVDIGELADDYNPDNFNKNTIIGAFEYYLYQATTYWPDARIGYIINYYTKGTKSYDHTITRDEYNEVYNLQRQACDKWGVDYLDLFTEEYDILFDVDSNKYIADNLHLNKDGQYILSEEVYNWMKYMSKHNSLVKNKQYKLYPEE